MESDDYFFDAYRHEQWLQAKAEEKMQLDHSENKEKKFGTVGAVAIDRTGNLAAATSTGGMTNKKFGRVGDTPIIGVGTYANNNTCAISCTGHGEYFMKEVVAYDVSCLMEYKNCTLRRSLRNSCSAKAESHWRRRRLNCGRQRMETMCLPFNSAGMYRGFVKEGEDPILAIYK
jgi:beta-aspartyl-peptidase (threonine type)